MNSDFSKLLNLNESAEIQDVELLKMLLACFNWILIFKDIRDAKAYTDVENIMLEVPLYDQLLEDEKDLFVVAFSLDYFVIKWLSCLDYGLFASPKLINKLSRFKLDNDIIFLKIN